MPKFKALVNLTIGDGKPYEAKKGEVFEVSQDYFDAHLKDLAESTSEKVSVEAPEAEPEADAEEESEEGESEEGGGKKKKKRK